MSAVGEEVEEGVRGEEWELEVYSALRLKWTESHPFQLSLSLCIT